MMENELQETLNNILEDKNTNLLPENLKQGVTCLGVEGTMQSGIDTSDATATSIDIAMGKTAYVNGQKITGEVEERTAGTFRGSAFTNPTSDDRYIEYEINILNRQGAKITMPNETIRDLSDTLLPENIKKDVSIFGVAGTYEGSSSEPLETIGTSVTDTSLLEDSQFVTLSGTVSDTGYVTENHTRFVAGTSYSTLVNTIGLTADKILTGNTILGVEGIVDPEGVQISDYFNTTPEDGQSLLKAYPDTIDCSKLTMFNFYNDFQNTYVPNLINTENITGLSAISNSGTLGFTQTELDVSSVSDFSSAFGTFYNITSTPKLKNLLKNNFYDGFGLNMFNMYGGCANLETIPEFEITGDWSIITMQPIINISGMITNCPKLSEQSITNILNFLKLLYDHNAIFDVQTLADIGLSYSQLVNLTEDQLAIINSMEGWTTGLEQFDTEVEIGELHGSIGGRAVTLDETLPEYLTLVESELNEYITEWVVSISVDFSTDTVFKFDTKEDVISFFNDIKFKSTSDTMTLNIQLSVKLSDGNMYGLTNYYDNIINTHTKSTINLEMMYFPIQLSIDTKGKDLTGWNIEISQTIDIGASTILSPLTNIIDGSYYVPVKNDTILLRDIMDYTPYNFYIQLITPENIRINTGFVEKGFAEENLTFTFSIGGTTLTDISQENTVVHRIMTFYDENNLSSVELQSTPIYMEADNFVETWNTVKLYNQDNIELSYTVGSLDYADTKGTGLCTISQSEYNMTDVTSYSYGPAREIDTSL